uniref:Centrosomal protein CEP104 N-terminal domain-containing protein n=1 Tax=Oryzias melastigma TaxID=30732 RepID=A0A3B3E1R0_ORYME
MQKKIKFSVISSSSHEDHFSAKELLVHAPTLGPFMFAFYILPYSAKETCSPLRYVSMSDNERTGTGFRARELKSVHVDAVGTFLKISLYRNHANPLSILQVSLVAINVLGEALDGSSFEASVRVLFSQCSLLSSVCEPMSPLDDLAFDMYQDPEVAYIIQILDQKKQDVVHQEDFEQAKMLKQAIADLQQVGERLARYDMEKRCAIEKEDYDLAKKKKEVMMELRRNIYQQLEVHGLLDMSTVQQDERCFKNAKVFTLQMYSTEVVVISLALWQVLNEERPLPTLQRKDWAAENLQSSGPHAERTPASSGRSVQLLSERALREAGPAADIYGESPVAEAFSRTWYQREQALLAVHNKLLEATSTSSKEELRNMIRAAGLLTRRALLDKVTLVFYASLKLLRLILIYIIPDVGLGRAEAAHCLQQTFPHLLQRTGDAAGRPRAAAIAFIQEIAVLKYVRSLQMIPAELMKPFKSSLAPPLLFLWQFSRVALDHSTKEVRELARRIILLLYQQHQGDVLDLLPPHDGAAPKNFLYKRLFDGFSQIDGKLTETQVRIPRGFSLFGDDFFQDPSPRPSLTPRDLGIALMFGKTCALHVLPVCLKKQ